MKGGMLKEECAGCDTDEPATEPLTLCVTVDIVHMCVFACIKRTVGGR